jgi:hypothetical protein
MSTLNSVSDLLDSEIEYRLRAMGLGECGKPDGMNKVTRPMFRAIVKACPEIKVEMVDISCRTCHGVGHLTDSINYREVPCPTCFGNGLESVWYRADQSID